MGAMKILTQQDLQLHVTILGWLHLIFHALLLVFGVFIFIFLPSIGALTGDQQAMMILGVVGTGVGALIVILALPGLVAGWSLLARKPWGRYLAIVVGILSLINVPIGTLVGAYTVWVLIQPAAADYFAPAPTPSA
jgi:hypothetical protein